MQARTEVLEKLYRITEQEWIAVSKTCKEHIKMKIKHKTIFGAHSQARLGMDPFQFYFHEALTKLYDGVWDWKFEKFSLLEQLTRIIDSLISEEVRKSKTAKEKGQKMKYMDWSEEENEKYLSCLDDMVETEEQLAQVESYRSIVEQVCKDYPDYGYICLELQDGKKYSEIAQDCGWTMNELYKKVELFKRQVNKLHDKIK